MSDKEKYYKYKSKYLKLKKQFGGTHLCKYCKKENAVIQCDENTYYCSEICQQLDKEKNNNTCTPSSDTKMSNEQLLLLLLEHSQENVFEQCQYLIEVQKTNVNSVNSDGKTPLLLLLEFQKVDVLKLFSLLLSKDADVKIGAPLSVVIEFQTTDVFELCLSLLEAGADVNNIDRYGRNPLSIALNKYSESIGTIPSETNCVVDDDGYNICDMDVPESYSKLELFLDIIMLLIKYGADVKTIEEFEPQIYNGDTIILSLLKKYPCDNKLLCYVILGGWDYNRLKEIVHLDPDTMVIFQKKINLIEHIGIMALKSISDHKNNITKISFLVYFNILIHVHDIIKGFDYKDLEKLFFFYRNKYENKTKI
jgi:hypothetical protein